MHDIEKNAGESNNNVGKLRLNTQLEINPFGETPDGRGPEKKIY